MVRREDDHPRRSSRVADPVSGIQKSCAQRNARISRRAEGRCVADVRGASRLRRPWRESSHNEKSSSADFAGKFTGPRLVRLRAAGDVPAVVSAWIALRGVDGQCGDQRVRLATIPTVPVLGLRAVGPEGSGVKRSMWPERRGGVATLRHNNDALTLRAFAISVKLKPHSCQASLLTLNFVRG